MQIHICLISSDPGATEIVRRKRLALIPKKLREHSRVTSIGANFSITVYDPNTAGRSLVEYLLEKETSEVHVLLADTAHGDVENDIARSCFITYVTFPNYPKINYENYFGGVFKRLIFNLTNFLSLINDNANKQVMLLPHRNFKARQLIELIHSCHREANSPEFINIVNSHINELKKRRRPHRKSNYPDQYFADDDEKLFQYGHERHAQIATGEPHTATCKLTGNFRFGKKIEADRHYNVTKESGKGSRIEGQFTSCHNQSETISSRTHLNMFSNDYIA